MKKLTLFLLALCVSAFAFGQVEVKSDGKVEITPSGNSGLSVNVAPSGNSNGTLYGMYGYSIGVATKPAIIKGTLYSAGVRGDGLLKDGSNNAAVAFGVVGYGRGSTQGRNIGVYGFFDSELQIVTIPPTPPVYGAGIFGAITLIQSERNFTKQYAGFFAGDVEATGSVTAASYITTSDARYKQNVADLRQTDTYRNVLRLNPVEYNLVQRYIEYTDSTGNRAQLGEFDENSQLFQKKHYGLIAQEVRELYPDLVYEDGNGYLSVDYVGVIPLLISSVKELNERVLALERRLNPNVNVDVDAAPQNAPSKPQQETEGAAALYQNTPNPFTENTEIAFYLPQSVTNAMLCVYDMNGKQLSQNIITQRGSSVFVVNGNQYGAGMYLYSLIADNQIVDTKRMILTK